MSEVTFMTKYKAGHSYQHTWTSTFLHCPNCGKQEVWKDTGGGDYYVGEQHMCLACPAVFYMPSFSGPPLDYVDQQTYDALRAADSANDGPIGCPYCGMDPCEGSTEKCSPDETSCEHVVGEGYVCAKCGKDVKDEYVRV